MFKISFFKNIIIFIVLVLSGCTPQKRLSRLLERHPELVTTTEREITITKVDTAFVPGDSASVTFDLSIAKELAAAHDGRCTIAEVDAVRSHATLTLLDPENNIYGLNVSTKADTIVFVRTDTVKVPEVIYSTKTEYKEKDLPWYDKFLNGFGCLCLIILIILLLAFCIKKFITH